MLEAGKTHHTSNTIIEIEGTLSSSRVKRLLNVLDKEWGLKANIYDDEELIDLNDSDWSKEVRASMIPGDYVRIYRENSGWNQTELGAKLGKFTKQYISDIEHGRREISKELAKKLSSLFEVPISRFI